MKNNFKRFFSFLLAGLIFSTSNGMFAFNGKMPDQVTILLKNYVTRYQENFGKEFEEELIQSLWQLYIGQFKRIKKRLNALTCACNIMIQECSKIDSPQHRKLEKILLHIKQNSDYHFIIENYGDLCTNSYFSRNKGISYGKRMQNPDRAIKHIIHLLYFERTGDYYI